MTKEEAKKMENSELIANFLMKRDNLVSIKRAMYDGTEGLEEIFEMERAEYETLLLEVYRRMKR